MSRLTSSLQRRHPLRQSQPETVVPRPFDPADELAARKAALQYIGRRDYCSYELGAKLKKRGFDADAADTVIASLEDEGILDAYRYIESFMSYQADRGNGPVRISSRLRALGFSTEVIGRSIETGRDWVADARQVCRRKFGPVLSRIHAERIRQARFLQYRGFTSAQISQALDVNVDN
jgi:regulatory protein